MNENGFDLFHELSDPWSLIVSAVVLVAAVVYAYKNAIRPVWSWATNRVHKQDTDTKAEWFFSKYRGEHDLEADYQIWQQLKKFTDQMPPNGGPSIWEMLEANEQAHARIFETLDHFDETHQQFLEELEELANKIDTFILNRRPNGRRSYDPKDPK